MWRWNEKTCLNNTRDAFWVNLRSYHIFVIFSDDPQKQILKTRLAIGSPVNKF